MKPLPPLMASRKACLPALLIGGLLVGLLLGEVAGRVEDEGVPLADAVGLKEASVLRGGDVEPLLLADLGEDALGQAELVPLAGDRAGCWKPAPNSW